MLARPFSLHINQMVSIKLTSLCYRTPPSPYSVELAIAISPRYLDHLRLCKDVPVTEPCGCRTSVFRVRVPVGIVDRESRSIALYYR